MDTHNHDQQAELRLALILSDSEEHEREITSGFDDDQLTEGDPCWLPRATELVSRS